MIRIRVENDTPELFAKIQAAAGRWMGDAVVYIQGEIASSMTEPKSGKLYKRGTGTHQASAPGESPAVDSSNLLTSIEAQIAASSLEAKIGTPVEYAAYLEEGTPRMAARPVWEKTVEESLPTLERMLAAELR